MSAAWAAVIISAICALGAVAAVIQRSAQRDGKIDAVLTQLGDLTEDHEYRLRALEGRHARPGRGARDKPGPRSL